ncbi:L-tyrosine/L-tryptophan isonitrile synthase family protein (plasmid) [Pontibacillus sp. ALD_SL1]|uniref:L-tyrosine/L-tryptophan isonitrile synthase family protein n=1 Tax=Pontibacillus sp. ALD_SL1 TaxID=2777185 RepID=UPI001A95E22A|nr:L-tyrosine/L-tryptophan isonitrile synthase family protein [Pontibacillus sp. ALD_SL1]QST02049.1 L-tyrosine/L-tryptophan isonitrile synthase family protein [Pontibacillus sp. ALD_SL1]
MNSIFSFSLQDLGLTEALSQYSVPASQESTVADLILSHLNSKPGFIKHKRSLTKNRDIHSLYSNAVHTVVAKGAPLDIFITAFTPKVTNPSTTNGHTLPDMADLLSLIHLHLVAKGIREIYDYGFRFIVAYKGRTYQPLFNWSNDTVKDTFDTLLTLRDAAESIVGIRNVVTFVDLEDLIEKEGQLFQKKILHEMIEVQNAYNDKVPYTIRKIDSWKRDFHKAINPAAFDTTEKIDSFLHQYALYFRSLKNIQYQGGEHGIGICNSFPQCLMATIRGIDEQLSIQLSPFFRFHSHQRLIAKTSNVSWKMMKWCDMEKSSSAFSPVYVKEFSYPFYFDKK